MLRYAIEIKASPRKGKAMAAVTCISYPNSERHDDLRKHEQSAILTCSIFPRTPPGVFEGHSQTGSRAFRTAGSSGTIRARTGNL